MPLRHQTKQLASQPAILVFKNLGARQRCSKSEPTNLTRWVGRSRTLAPLPGSATEIHNCEFTLYSEHFFTGNSNQDFRQLTHEKVIYIPTASNICILSQEFMTLSQLMSNLVLTRDLA